MAPGITRWVKARLITFFNRHGYRYGTEKCTEDEFQGQYSKKKRILLEISNQINVLFEINSLYLDFFYLSNFHFWL